MRRMKEIRKIEMEWEEKRERVWKKYEGGNGEKKNRVERDVFKELEQNREKNVHLREASHHSK